MELNKVPEFNKIDSIVHDVLSWEIESNEKYELQVLGKYYYLFILSNNKFLSIKVPRYDYDFLNIITEYLYYLDLTLKLFIEDRVQEYNGTVVFDIFGFCRIHSEDFNRLIFPFSEVNEKEIIYGTNSEFVISREKFIPLFEPDDALILRSLQREVIIGLFRLFHVISSKNLINHPVHIDLKVFLSLFLSRSFFERNKGIKSDFINYKDRISSSEQELRNFVSFYRENGNLSNVLIVKYPYYVDIDPRIYKNLDSVNKIFEINFKHRLLYIDEINNHELYLLPEEIQGVEKNALSSIIESFEIVNTYHPPELFQKLKDLKANWKSFEHNKYLTPYPAFWFMIINKSEDCQFWKTQFAKNYPQVKGAILNDIFEIIEIIYEIDWLIKYLQIKEGSAVIIPHYWHNLSQSVNLQAFIENDLKTRTFEYLGDIKELLSNGGNIEAILLDPFNTIALSNIEIETSSSIKYRLPVPDFIFFNHQPFIKYLIAKYKYEALTLGAREHYDSTYIQNVENWHRVRFKILQDCRKELAKYIMTYGQKEFEQEVEPELKDYELTEDEIIEETTKLVDKKRTIDKSCETIIVTTEDKVFDLRPNSKVIILKQGYTVTTNAVILEEGMLFLPYSELNKEYDKDFINKLSQIPDSAKTWQIKLNDLKESGIDVYEDLRNNGLSIKTKYHFDNAYLLTYDSVDDEHLPTNLPRLRSDWVLICKYLKISKSDEDLARACYYGRRDINKLQTAYAKVLSFIYDNSLLGETNNSELILKISKILEEEAIFEIEDEIDFMGLAKSLILSINDHIEFHEVKSIEEV